MNTNNKDCGSTHVTCICMSLSVLSMMRKPWVEHIVQQKTIFLINLNASNTFLYAFFIRDMPRDFIHSLFSFLRRDLFNHFIFFYIKSTTLSSYKWANTCCSSFSITKGFWSIYNNIYLHQYIFTYICSSFFLFSRIQGSFECRTVFADIFFFVIAYFFLFIHSILLQHHYAACT